MEAFRFERRMESESPKSIYNCFAIPVLASLWTGTSRLNEETWEAQSNAVKMLLPTIKSSTARPETSIKENIDGLPVGSCKMPREFGVQSIPRWNQIIAWLRDMETLRKAAA